jgi:hypothetical protein
MYILLTVDSIVNIGGNLLGHTSWILLVIFNITAYENSLTWCKLRNMLIHCFGLISILTMCFAACDQFFSISCLLFKRKEYIKISSSFNFDICVLCNYSWNPDFNLFYNWFSKRMWLKIRYFYFIIHLFIFRYYLEYFRYLFHRFWVY